MQAGLNSHPLSIRVWLAAIWAAAFALRLVFLWQIHDAPFFDLRFGDAGAYHQWAQRIAAGDWAGQGVFYQSPLYAYFLAIVYRLIDDSAATVRVLQAAIGAGSCALLALAGYRLYEREGYGRAGLIAGFGLAVYPPAIFLDSLLEKSSLVTFFTAALLAALAVSIDRMTPARWLGMGTILGLLALARENALLLAIPILIWMMANVSRSKSFLAALAFVSGCGLVLLPVGLRNLAAGGEFHLTTAQFGPNFYIGNHEGATGTYQPLVTGHGSADDERADATRLAENSEGRKLSPAEVSRFWTRRAVEFITSHPVDWLQLMGRKLVLSFNAAEIADTESQDVYAEWSGLLRLLGFLNFGILLGLAVAGMFFTAASRGFWLIFGLAAVYAVSVALFYVFARYRFPLAAMLMLPAAIGAYELIRRLAARRFRGVAIAGAAGILAVVFAHIPLDDPRTARATNYLNIGRAFAATPEHAMEFYKRALDIDPDFPAAQMGAGSALANMGRTDEAIPYYRAAVTAWPQYAEARYNLGLALAATGRFEEAAQEYSEALRQRADADTHIALGKALVGAKHPDLAMEHYRQGLALRPGDVIALVGLGVALTQSGRGEEAIGYYGRALELDPANAAAHNSMGFTLAGLGRLREALPHFERAVSLNPGDEGARRNLETVKKMLR